MKKKIIYILILAILAMVCYLTGYFRAREHFRGVTKKVTDSLVVRDTHVIEKPVLVEQTRKETLLVQVHDTIRIKDTLYISLPQETKTYKGEDYCAEVSGYQPSLDRIEVYPKTVVISKTETTTQTVTNRNALAIGLNMNYSSHPDIPIYLEYSYLLHRNVEMSARLQYDLPSQEIGFGLGAKISIGW